MHRFLSTLGGCGNSSHRLSRTRDLRLPVYIIHFQMKSGYFDQESTVETNDGLATLNPFHLARESAKTAMQRAHLHVRADRDVLGLWT